MRQFIEKLSRKTVKTKSGFTMIEFSIALVILSLLLIIILQISNNTIAIYQKGLATKAVSTAGRELLDELTKSIAASPTGSLAVLCEKTGINNCKNDASIQAQMVYQKAYNGSNPAYGMFCTGKYSYFWNSGYALKNGTGKPVSYSNVSGVKTKSDVALVRFDDTGRDLCINHMKNKSLSVPNASSYTELLQNEADLRVALYDFTIFTPSQDKTISRVFYSGTFVLGTMTGVTNNITATNDYCRGDAMNSLSSDSAYCSINKFNFAAQALGEQND